MSDPVLLDSRQMAHFAARGFLQFDAVVPDSINRAFLSQVGHADRSRARSIREHYAGIMASSDIPLVPPGTPLIDAYPEGSTLRRLLDLPLVRGAVRSLVGPDCLFDHHFLHITYPPEFYAAQGRRPISQHYHQDSTIDPRRAFDVQIMYFPHAVTAEMGGTRFVPGSHLRVVSESAIARYQNILGQRHVMCPAGSLLFLHQGIWHGGGVNRSRDLRYMFKIRLCPTHRQRRLWDTSDLPRERRPQRPIFWTGGGRDRDGVDAVLTRREPWFEADTERLEYINRIRFWRYLLGDDGFDADYWLSRIENDPV